MVVNILFQAQQLTKTVFGIEATSYLSEIMAKFGKKGLMVTDRNLLPANLLTSTTDSEENKYLCKLSHLVLDGAPTTKFIDKAVEFAHDKNVDFVVCIGGGGALDAGKMIAGLYTNGGITSDYIRQLGNNGKFTESSLPCITVPTLPGTGSEVSHSVIITVEDLGRRFMINSEYLSPAYTIIDPKLSFSSPHSLTAISALSSIILCIETYVSNRSNVYSDLFALEGIKKGLESIVTAYKYPTNEIARSNIAFASYCGGVASNSSSKGAISGIASPVSCRLGLPFGQVYVSLLLPVLRTNLALMKKKSQSIAKYETIASLIPGRRFFNKASPNAMITYFEDLIADIDVPVVGKDVITQEQYDSMIFDIMSSTSTEGNPTRLTQQDIEDILDDILC